MHKLTLIFNKAVKMDSIQNIYNILSTMLAELVTQIKQEATVFTINITKKKYNNKNKIKTQQHLKKKNVFVSWNHHLSVDRKPKRSETFYAKTYQCGHGLWVITWKPPRNSLKITQNILSSTQQHLGNHPWHHCSELCIGMHDSLYAQRPRILRVVK